MRSRGERAFRIGKRPGRGPRGGQAVEEALRGEKLCYGVGGSGCAEGGVKYPAGEDRDHPHVSVLGQSSMGGWGHQGSWAPFLEASFQRGPGFCRDSLKPKPCYSPDMEFCKKKSKQTEASRSTASAERGSLLDGEAHVCWQVGVHRHYRHTHKYAPLCTKGHVCTPAHDALDPLGVTGLTQQPLSRAGVPHDPGARPRSHAASPALGM